MLKSIAEMIKKLTKVPLFQIDIVKSGVAWKCLKTVFFQLKEEVGEYVDLKETVRLCVTDLKNILSFSNELVTKGLESFALKNISKENQTALIIFNQIFKKLFAFR